MGVGITRWTHTSYIRTLPLSEQLMLKCFPLITIASLFLSTQTRKKRHIALVFILVTRQTVHYIRWHCDNLFTNTGLITLLWYVNEFSPFSHLVFLMFIRSPITSTNDVDMTVISMMNTTTFKSLQKIM